MLITNLTQLKAEFQPIPALWQDHCPFFSLRNQGRKKGWETQNTQLLFVKNLKPVSEIKVLS